MINFSARFFILSLLIFVFVFFIFYFIEPNVKRDTPLNLPESASVRPDPNEPYIPMELNQSNSKCGTQKKSICYVTDYYIKRYHTFRWQEEIDPNLCTHIIYTNGYVDQHSRRFLSGLSPWFHFDYNLEFLAKIAVLKKTGAKVSIAIDETIKMNDTIYHFVLTNPQMRRTFAEEAEKIIEKYDLNGVELNFEYPVYQTSVKEGLSELIKELSDRLKPQGLLLSAALFADTRLTDVAYDIPTLSHYLDWISLKQDNRTDFNDETCVNPDNNSQIKAAVDHWLKKGAAPEKLVLGMYAFPWFSTSGIIGREWAFDELCAKNKSDGWKVVRDPRNKMASYLKKNDQLLAFDDVENISTKGKLICEENLGGGVLWMLDFDDPDGSCGCGKFPLITALSQEIRGIGGVAAQNCV